MSFFTIIGLVVAYIVGWLILTYGVTIWAIHANSHLELGAVAAGVVTFYVMGAIGAVIGLVGLGWILAKW